MRNTNMQLKTHQQGAVLAIGLILLLIITLMGYTGMKSTMLQEKMAAGLHNRSLANSGSHSALREGEEFLYNLIENTNGVDVVGTPNGALFNIYSMYQQVGVASSGENTIAAAFKNNDWTATGGTATSKDYTAVTEKGAALSVQPQYIIQHLRDTDVIASPFGGAAASGGATHEFGATGSGGGGSSVGSGAGTVQDTYLITAKSRSGDGNSFAITQTVYTAVTSSPPTN
ncbi:pilus assembly PilX family protein [Marinicella litoralis]|uniref:Tfp pilus assembly protein PilX n=1 Tax=Marinicella litoralis TaxID=644220 RepID=A0A4R6XGB4_9GAMM|nr:PilX N-terminal domain-containing pilus assembly protein [Marinicella litoralis]TDR18422.1 Tfp pilus assembly protein PilX [Marinicella litoralis]